MKKPVLAIILIFLISPYILLVSAQAESQTTLLFAEGFNTDLSRWSVYTGPNSTVNLQDVIYNSSPYALKINVSDYLAAIVHTIPELKADYTIEFLFYPEGNLSNYGLYRDFNGELTRVYVYVNGLAVFINNVQTNASLTDRFWNAIRLVISYTGEVEIYVNNVFGGIYPCNSLNVTGIILGTWLNFKPGSGCGYFDDLKVYITPTAPSQPPVEPVNIVDFVLLTGGIATIVVGLLAFIFGRLYFAGKGVKP